MTLIAAFESHEAPVLLGDVLVTRRGVPSSLRKKVARITPRFAIAWTGHELAAHQITCALQDEFAAATATMDKVTTLLTGGVEQDLGALDVRLLGYLVDDENEVRFRWNSLWPGELFVDEVEAMYDGVGDTHALALAGARGLSGMPTTGRTQQERVDRGALFVAGHLMTGELVGASTIPLGYGFAYDVLRRTGARGFEWLSNVLFYAMEHRFSVSGTYLESRFVGSMCKHELSGEHTILHTIDLGRSERQTHVIKPVGRVQRAETQEAHKVSKRHSKGYPFAADYYCSYQRLVMPGFECPPIVQTLGRGDAPGFIQVPKKGVIEIRVNRSMLEHALAAIRADVQHTA